LRWAHSVPLLVSPGPDYAKNVATISHVPVRSLFSLCKLVLPGGRVSLLLRFRQKLAYVCSLLGKILAGHDQLT